MDPTQISFDMVRQKLKDIVMTRGKRGVDRNEQVEMLSYLATVAKGPVQKIEVLIQVVSALFDINPSMSTHMSVPLWKRCAGTLLEVLQTLADNQYIEVEEAYDNPEERTEEPPAGQPAKVRAFKNCVWLRHPSVSVTTPGESYGLMPSGVRMHRGLLYFKTCLEEMRLQSCKAVKCLLWTRTCQLGISMMHTATLCC